MLYLYLAPRVAFLIVWIMIKYKHDISLLTLNSYACANVPHVKLIWPWRNHCSALFVKASRHHVNLGSKHPTV